MRHVLLVMLACSVASADPLGNRWNETEGVWHGTWVRRPGTSTFDASWYAQEHGTEHATLVIRIDGKTVIVERTQPDQAGTCTYRGQLAGDRVAGTYTCSWGGTKLPWSARIER